MRLTIWAIPILFALSGAASAQTRDMSDAISVRDEVFRASLSSSDAAEVERLIPQLGSNDYEEREAATERLALIGRGALERLRTAYLSSDDLEVRLRIEDIVHAAYLMYHVFDRYGFLGISQHPVPATSADDSRIRPGHMGIRISEITADTGAERAGLKKGDVIIAMNGDPIKEGRGVNADFGATIRRLGPRTVVSLTILRSVKRRTRQLEVEATLGRCPEYLVRSRRRRVGEIPEKLLHTEQLFPAWWAKHFREPTNNREE
ncbi:MAG: PDZ domain-containing protein [Planctomycetes bacterium]|nr:PDZ domain-containing protein [Planctomycetota bacterium]